MIDCVEVHHSEIVFFGKNQINRALRKEIINGDKVKDNFRTNRQRHWSIPNNYFVGLTQD